MIRFILERILFPIGDFILESTMMRDLEECRKISAKSENELIDLQQKKLMKILKHAVTKSAYYSKFRFDENEDVDVVALLKKFPILTKGILRSEQLNLLTKPLNECILYETSGSSGIPTSVYVDKVEQSIFRAILICWWEWTGYYLGKPMVQTGMTTTRGFTKRLKDILTNTIYLNAFQMRAENVVPILKSIEGKKNYHLGGYASSLFILAKLAERNAVHIKFDGIISWGDKMFDHYKAKIESVFNTKVYENYGCNEGIMIGQKVDLPYFYIYTPNVFLEILDENDFEVQDGEIGKVVVTKLDGFAMPLIRYETGDLAVKLPKAKYPATRKFNFPLLERVIGRDTDIIKTPDGNVFIVHTFTGIFEFFKEIRQFRVIQNVLEEINIEYIPDIGFNESILQQIEKEILKKTESKILIKWTEVLEIQPSPSGKPQIILNNYIQNLKNNATFK